jgi:hypothetical protein
MIRPGSPRAFSGQTTARYNARMRLLLLALCASVAFGQAYRVDPTPVITTSGTAPTGGYRTLYAVAGASVNICNDLACTSPATTYTNAAGNVTCPVSAPITLVGQSTCQTTTGQQGQFGFWLAVGTYYYSLLLPNGTAMGPFAISVGGSGSSGGTLNIGVGGVIIGNEPTLNFIPGTGILQSCSDNTGAMRVDCTPAADTSYLLSRVTDQAGTDKTLNATSGAAGVTWVANATPTLTTYTQGQAFVFVPTDSACAVGATLSIDGIGPLPLKKVFGSSGLVAISAGDCLQNVPVWVKAYGSPPNAWVMGPTGTDMPVLDGAQYSMAYYPNAGTNPTIGPLPSGGSIIGPIGLYNPSGFAGAVGEVGNTTYPALSLNTVYDLGPNNASFPPYAKQWPSAGPANLGPVIANPVGIVITGGSYSSGLTSCTNGTQAVTYSGGSATTNATGTITVAGGVPVGAISLSTPGSGYNSAPTAATVATCTGNPGTITGAVISNTAEMAFGSQTGTGSKFVTNVNPLFGVNNSVQGKVNFAGTSSSAPAYIEADPSADLILGGAAGQGADLYSGAQFLLGCSPSSSVLGICSFGVQGSIAGQIWINAVGNGTTLTDGLINQNLVAATSGTTAQYSPTTNYCGTAYNSVSAASELDCFRQYIFTVPTAGTTTSRLQFAASINGGAYSNTGSLDSSGRWTSTALTITGPSIVLSGLGSATGTPDALCLNSTVVTVNAALTCTVSNGKFKNSIRPLNRAMPLLLKLRPVGFQYNAVAGRERWGFEARQTASVNPALADGWLNAAGERHQIRQTGDEPQSLDQNAILALTVKGLQEEVRLRNVQIAALTKRLAALEAKTK